MTPSKKYKLAMSTRHLRTYAHMCLHTQTQNACNNLVEVKIQHEAFLLFLTNKQALKEDSLKLYQEIRFKL